MYGFLDGSRSAPSPVITVQTYGATQVIPNLEFRQWHLQDQMLLSALISSLSEIILAHVVKCVIPREVWLSLLFRENVCLAWVVAKGIRPRFNNLFFHLKKKKKKKDPATFTPWCETVFSHHGCG
jgi:hypothetical protein